MWNLSRQFQPRKSYLLYFGSGRECELWIFALLWLNEFQNIRSDKKRNLFAIQNKCKEIILRHENACLHVAKEFKISSDHLTGIIWSLSLQTRCSTQWLPRVFFNWRSILKVSATMTTLALQWVLNQPANVYDDKEYFDVKICET